MDMTLLHPDDAADLMGDGYSNELQRCAAWSQMQPKDDDAAWVDSLLSNHLCVAVEYRPRYCRGTDAIIGETVHVVGANLRRNVCSTMLNNLFARGKMDDDSRYLILPHVPQVVSPVVSPVVADEVPF